MFDATARKPRRSIGNMAKERLRRCASLGYYDLIKK
jgi:hypothetical protein